jgi:hypothetical protein
VLATQTLWQSKPKNMRIVIDGILAPGVRAKDVILAIIARIGTAGGTGHVIEYAGSTIRALGIEGRLTICNMSRFRRRRNSRRWKQLAWPRYRRPGNEKLALGVVAPRRHGTIVVLSQTQPLPMTFGSNTRPPRKKNTPRSSLMSPPRYGRAEVMA